jgi:hypothetical protein
VVSPELIWLPNIKNMNNPTKISSNPQIIFGLELPSFFGGAETVDLAIESSLEYHNVVLIIHGLISIH